MVVVHLSLVHAVKSLFHRYRRGVCVPIDPVAPPHALHFAFTVTGFGGG